MARAAAVGEGSAGMAKGPKDRGPKDKADGGPKGLANGLTNYGDNDFSLYLRRSFAGAMGYTREIMDRPVVGICSSPSNYNACHRHMPELVEAVKRGVLAAGGGASGAFKRADASKETRIVPVSSGVKSNSCTRAAASP